MTQDDQSADQSQQPEPPPPAIPETIQTPGAQKPRKLRLKWLFLLWTPVAAAFGLFYYFNQTEFVIDTLNVKFDESTFSFLSVYLLLPLTLVLTLFWWTFLSGVSWRGWFVGLVLVAAAGGGLAASVRVESFEGDMFPRLAWRWDPTSEDLARAAKGAREKSDLEVSERTLTISEDDWPEFRNDDREGHVLNVQLDRDFEAHPPEELWRIKVGLGWSSFSIVDDLCWTQEQLGDEELVVCYELETGKEVWTHADKTRWSEPVGGDGPRGTPTISDGKAYTLGGTGLLNCLNALTGELIWQRNILEDAGADNVQWAMSGSPLVVDKMVVVNAGIAKADLEKDPKQRQSDKAVIAYDKLTGEMIWAQGKYPASYAGVHVAELDGQQSLIVYDGNGVAGVDPADGRELWRFEWSNMPKVNAVQPIARDNQVFISSSYNKGSVLLNVNRTEDAWSVEPEWEKKNFFKLKFNDGVYKDGYIYGLDETLMSCIEMKSGRRMWKARSDTGFGQLILVGDTLVIITEQGELVFADATPEEWRELYRLPVMDGKTWNNPAFARGYLIVRNYEEAVCLKLKLAEEPPQVAESEEADTEE
ncbi:MAG: PQQ-like beta-propeller repeat protein [Planctomycetaceae bacterium]|nr:PQQ-like beta-propeller repeat protein [Planctomycetaceae bacterium]